MILRKIPFSFDENISPVWNSEKPEWSHMVNGASLTMPYLEPFLIKTAREALRQVKDPALEEDIRIFIGQEAQHYQNHRRYNDKMKANGYEELAQIEDEMEADFKRLQSKSLRWRVAYMAGFETMTMGITKWLVEDRSELFRGADASVVSFVLWHMVEETEHKTVAFDLYQALYRHYGARVYGLFYASWHIVKYTRKTYISMLKKDGRWRRIASRLRLAQMILQFYIKVGPSLLKSLSPSYHPSKVKDPDWVKEWIDAYQELPEDHIPLLDTSHPDISAQFAPSA